MIDKDKQRYGSWSTNDISLSCFCGNAIMFNDIDDNNSSQKECPTCGQKWIMFLSIVPVKEEVDGRTD